MDDITRTYVGQWEEAEKLFKEFKVITFGNKKTLTGLISQANNSETLKCVDPGNIIIENRTSGDRTFFPGAWFISNERVCLYKHGMLGTESNRYDYPLEALQSVSAHGNGIASGKIYLTTDTDLITLEVSYKEEVYRKVESVLNELIHGALDLRQNDCAKETEQLGVAICSSCRASKILAKGAVSNCDYCRQPISLETSATSLSENQMTTSPASSADEIMKYKALLDMGAITEEEFENKKKILLEM